MGCLCVIGGHKTWTANLGDCRGLAVSLSGEECLLSVDQRVGDGAEYKRIVQAGGSVVGNSVEGLMPSRTLGDADVKNKCPPGVILAEPEIRVWEGQGILVLATDGLWDVLSVADVVGSLPPGKGLLRACQDKDALQEIV